MSDVQLNILYCEKGYILLKKNVYFHYKKNELQVAATILYYNQHNCF